MDNFFAAFLLTLLAGLSTGIGSLIALLSRRTDKKFLSICLGFSAGVMIYVSMADIFFKARESLTAVWGAKPGSWATVAAFFGGILLIGVIDRLIPSAENPHEVKSLESAALPHASRLMRMGLFTALAIAVHSLAAFVSALQAPNVALPIVAAIAIHNFPEGIAVSVPIYQATGSRRSAFIYSFLSGLAEPLGALAGYLVLLPIMSEAVMGLVFAGVAGIMVFISIDELLPAAREYGEAHLSIYGFVLDMAFMAASLLLFQ